MKKVLSLTLITLFILTYESITYVRSVVES